MRRVLLALAILLTPVAAKTEPLVCASPGITDGDTVRCGSGVRIRLWGIQAPERDQPGGPAATRALAQIIDGRDLICDLRGKSYNRVVARCWAGGEDIAEAMVTRGHAADWPKHSGGFYGAAR